MATGVIASSDTPGTAVDVCAINNLAVVADATAGVVVFNVTSGQNPVRIAQIDTPGNAQRVACSGNLIAVADGSAGLAVIDITDPPTARILHQVDLGGSAQAVATAGGVAFVGLSSGQLVSVDLANGTVLERVNAGAAIHDLSIEGDVLFVLINSQLRAYNFADGALEFIGGSTAPGFFRKASRDCAVCSLEVVMPMSPVIPAMTLTTCAIQRPWRASALPRTSARTPLNKSCSMALASAWPPWA